MGAEAYAPDTVIMGAGAAGLAVAGVLAQHGLTATVLDRAPSIGSAWRNRYDSLRLHTARGLSGLPGFAIPRRYGRWVARDDLVAYLEEYAQHFGIEPELGVQVQRMERQDDGWQVVTDNGTRSARHVVIATGFTRTPFVPDWPGRTTFVGDLRHSSAYREPSPYAGQDVLVVGAGNSGTEIAVDLLGVAKSVSLSVRTPPNIVRREVLGIPSQLVGIVCSPVPEPLMNPMSGLLRRISVPDLSSYGLPAPRHGFSQFLRSQTVPVLDHGFVDAVRDDRIRVVAGIESFVGDEVRLTDHTIRYPDAVIAATGYSPDLGPLVGDLPLLDERGIPRIHGSATLPESPGLYVVGISVVLSGQLREVAREAVEVGRAIAVDQKLV